MDYVLSTKEAQKKERWIEESRRHSKIMALNEATSPFITLQHSTTRREADYLLVNKGTNGKGKCMF